MIRGGGTAGSEPARGRREEGKAFKGEGKTETL